MSEPIKFTQEELDNLGKIQSKYQENTFQFGQLYLDKLSLDEKFKQLTESEASLKNNFLEIQKEEETWLNSITAKYGEGSLSLKDGTFKMNRRLRDNPATMAGCRAVYSGRRISFWETACIDD